MKCSKCHQDKPRLHFSRTQLKHKVQKRVCVVCATPTPEQVSAVRLSEQLSRYFSWLKNQGVHLHQGIFLDSVSERYRLVRTSNAIPRNTPIISVRLPLLIRETEAIKRWKPKLQLTENDINRHTWLALSLLEEREKKEQSFWAPYIDALPKEYPNFVLSQQRKEKATTLPAQNEDNNEPDESLIEQMRSSRLKKIESDYCKFIQRVVPWTFHEYLWARTTVITRVFKVFIHGQEDTVFVPFADMLNHSAKPNVTWSFQDKENAFVMTTTKYVPKASEMVDSYGPKCNSRYFVNYGFNLRNNKANNQGVLFLPAASSQLLQKLGELNAHQLKDFLSKGQNVDDGYSGYDMAISNGWEKRVSELRQFRFQLGVPSNKATNKILLLLLRLVRLLVIDPESDDKILKDFVVKTSFLPEQPLSLGNERASAEFVCQQLQNRLGSIPTSAFSEDATLCLEDEREIIHELLACWTAYSKTLYDINNPDAVEQVSKKFWRQHM